MKVTRDVIYDLLPGYFSGDISPDTRALVDEFLQQDPDFRQMMERFRTVFREPRPAAATTAVPGDKETFERARSLMHKRSELRGYVIAFGLAAIFVLFVATMRLTPGRPAGGPWAVIALAFLATSLISWYQLYRLRTGGR